MPTQWNPPLPAVPSSHYPSDVAPFLLTQKPEEVLALFEGMAAADNKTGVWSGEFDPFMDGLRANAREHADHVVAIFTLIAKHADSCIRELAPPLFKSVLCRGFEDVEGLAWDDLLQDVDDDVFELSYELLLEMVADDGPGPHFPWTDAAYDQIISGRWPERLTHYLKLGRTKPRYEAIIQRRRESASAERDLSSPATSA